METSSNIERPKYKSSTWYYHNVEGYREKVLQWTKECIARRKAENPEVFNEKAKNYMRNKYQNDPEYRERQKQRALARYYAKKGLTNPVESSE